MFFDLLDSGDESSKPATLSFPTEASKDKPGEVSPAHVALNTAYKSLKTRLLRSEAENKKLQRRLTKMSSPTDTSVPNSSSAAKVPQEDSVGEVHGNLLRPKVTQRIANQDNINHQRHGSWGYTNDRPGETGQYCRLLEIQLAKIEEERDRLRSELKDVRVKLTDQTLRSENTKRQETEHLQHIKRLQEQVRTAELRVADAGHQHEMLQKQVRDAQVERGELKSKIRSLERSLTENTKPAPRTSRAHPAEKNGA